jgi:hypothetical protein
MTGSSRPLWRRGLFHAVIIVGVAGVIILAVWYFRPKPLLSPDDPPDVTYQKIANAYGGPDSLARWTSGRLEYEVELDFPGIGKANGHFRETFQLPGKLRREFRHSFRGETTNTLMITDGNSVWLNKGDEPIQTTGDNPYKDARCVEVVRGFHPVYLFDHGEKMSIQGVGRRTDGRRHLIINISRDDGEPSECHVDLLTGFIHQYIGPIPMPLRPDPVTVRYEYTDYRSTSGGPVPYRMMGYHDGHKVIDMAFTLIDLDSPIEPAAFQPPTH